MQISFNKYVSVIAAIILSFLIASTAPAADTDKAAETAASGNVTVATVNGKAISKDALDRKADLIQKRYASMGMVLDAEKTASLRENILQSLIEQELLYQESQKQGIKVDDAQVAEELANFKDQFESEAEYANQLKEMSFTEDVLKSQIRENLAIRKLIEEKVVAEINITDDEAKAYYNAHPEEFKTPERVRARHILIKVNKDATPEEKAKAREKIDAIKAKVDAGGDFEALAAESSECPSSKQGGDLGFFEKGQMVEPFEKVAFALKPGEVSDVVETQFGYHIIKAEGKQEASTESFDDAKEKLKDHLKMQAMKEKLPQYIEKLKAAATIDISMPTAAAPAGDKPEAAVQAK